MIDPSFQAFIRGRRAVYLVPCGTTPTATEREFLANEPPAIPGVEVAETAIGRLYFRRDPVERLLAMTPEMHGVVARDQRTGALDIKRTIAKIVEQDVVGALLQYGAGNESKAGGTHTVTGRDARGREITTIIAKNPRSAYDALVEHHGATTVEAKPLEQGVFDILRERGLTL